MSTSRMGDQWICQNVACKLEFVVITPSEVTETSNFYCFCGSEMMRRYSAPVVQKHKFDEAEAFLRDAEIFEQLRVSRSKATKS